MFLNLFTRHLLEYGNVVWDPHFALNQQLLEKVQWRATKLKETQQVIITRAAIITYVHYRRWHGDTVILTRTLFQPLGVADIRYLNIQFSTTQEPTSYHVAIVLVVTMWNSLPSVIVEAPIITIVKSHLDDYWANLMYDIN